MQRPHTSNPIRQRGAAALLVVTALFCAMLLVALQAGRLAVTEQRSAAHQVQSTQAFEAAEAGLEWALALLNDSQPVGDDCRPTDAATGRSLRERIVGAAGVTTQHASCFADADGWRCSCPGGSAVNPEGTSPAPGFAVQFASSAEPGRLQLRAKGCAQQGGACASGDDSGGVATADIRLALLPGLRSAPAAAIVEGHTADADRHFAAHFGLTREQWARQPAVTPVTCNGDCSGALQAAVAARPDARLFSVDGDLTLSAPLQLGTAERPVVVVASGAVELRGDVVVHGVIHGRSLRWTGAPTAAARLHGALIAQTEFATDGTPDLQHDAAVLQALQRDTGSWVRVAGGWRDF